MTELENITKDIDSIEKRVESEINSAAVTRVVELEKEITQLNNVIIQIEPLAINLVTHIQEGKTIIAGLNEKIITMKASIAPVKIEVPIEIPVEDLKVG